MIRRAVGNRVARTGGLDQATDQDRATARQADEVRSRIEAAAAGDGVGRRMGELRGTKKFKGLRVEVEGSRRRFPN